MTVQEDRRDTSVRRIPFEALVEIGGHGTPAFEAESLDVSIGGMQLRSAYLPELGQPIVCRFDSGEGDPICAEGHVVWREKKARGGELGIQFTNVDEPSAAALLEMCGVAPADADPTPQAPKSSAPAAESELAQGSRVRLHIDGLGAPMRARVRQIGDKKLLVGSNLDFLRLGRALEIETVGQEDQRPAEVERVAIDVDPASKVPQLVVELRYMDVEEGREEAVTIVPHSPSVAEPIALQATAEPIPAPQPAAEEPPVEAAVESVREISDEPVPTLKTRAAIRPRAEEEREIVANDELEIAAQMKEGLSRAAEKIRPALAQMGSRARTTVELLLAKSRGEDVASDEPAAPPRRTTAPPPAGALQAHGRTLIREGEPGSFEPSPRKTRSRAIALGAAAGMMTVLLLLALRKPSEAPVEAAAASETAALAMVAGEDSEAIDRLANLPPDTVVANVPLFGPTPLSTNLPPREAAESHPEEEADDADDFEAAPVAKASPRPLDRIEAEHHEPIAPQPKPQKEAAPAKPTKVAAFTYGKMSRPKRLRLRLDGDITSLRGKRSADGFEVTIPNRRSQEKAGPLASRDDRILSSRIMNRPHGAELTMRFKDKVPAFAVRASGNELIIELETAKPKPTATAKRRSGR